MSALLRVATILLAGTGVMSAQGDLSELFSILRKEGPALSENSRQRTVEIVSAYSPGGKSLSGEWPAINEALGDAKPFVRGQACAVLSSLLLLRAANPAVLPDQTRELVVQRLDEAAPNVRENAMRVLELMAGGVPGTLFPRMLQLARADPALNVRRMAIDGLASVPAATPEINELWIEILSREQDRESRGAVLNSFRFHAPTDARVIQLAIGALRDSDRFVRQEAVAAVTRIGKPAVVALPLLRGIEEASAADEAMRLNAEAAIRSISQP